MFLKLIILPILFLISSNLCLSQHHHDSLFFQYLERIWEAPVSENYPIIHLDSNELDIYKKFAPDFKTELRMKFGYVRDKKSIYCFDIISSDLHSFLADTIIHSQPELYPKNVFFKLLYVFDGSKLKCYNTHVRRSGSTEEFKLFWEPMVDHSFQGFNLPFIVKNEIKYKIKKWYD